MFPLPMSHGNHITLFTYCPGFPKQQNNACIASFTSLNILPVSKYDDKELGVLCIEFGPADESLGCDYPRWLSPKEFESVTFDEDKE